MTSAANGVLLIDEFENGLHYSVQWDLWGRVFEIAEEPNVQGFATTRSRDCIESFQVAAEGGGSARLVSLERGRMQPYARRIQSG